MKSSSNIRYGIENVLRLCERHFFARVVSENSVVDRFKFGPPGELLKDNVHSEWVYSNVVNTEHNVFPYSGTGTASVSELSEPYAFVKRLSGGKLPFSIADTWVAAGGDDETTSVFAPRWQTWLRTTTFAAPAHALQLFDSCQRHRKIWWRKFSASPGRFSLTDVQSVDGEQSVHIRAEFPWGSETVEKISLRDSAYFDTLDTPSRKIFQARDGNRQVLPRVVQSVTSLERAVVTYLCDGYEEDEFKGEPRLVMRFHRKLAPYKAAFAVSDAPAAATEELGQLAVYLSRQLRKAGVPTLLPTDVTEQTVTAQLARNDEMGVPYTFVLNESTLRTGIADLHSRNTTLREQVHVTELKNYMEQLLKNY